MKNYFKNFNNCKLNNRKINYYTQNKLKLEKLILNKSNNKI